MSYCCKECGFDLWQYVARIPSAHVGLYDDNRYPGRCLVVLPRHAEEFAELTKAEMFDFMFSVQRVAKAIKNAVGATRMNYAILGNAVPHIHAHIIPRFEDDPNPNSSPWSRSDKAKAMPKEKSQEIIQRIREELDLV